MKILTHTHIINKFFLLKIIRIEDNLFYFCHFINEVNDSFEEENEDDSRIF